MSHERKKQILIFLALLVGACVLYYPAFSVGFLSDDYHWLFVTKERSGSVFQYFLTNIIGERQGSSYGPIANLFFTFLYSVFHLHAFWYHAVIVLFHAATAYVLFLLVQAMTGKTSAGVLSALLFLVFFHHSEAIVWVASFPHVLSALFYLGAMYAYYRFIHEKKPAQYIAAVGLGMLAFFTKEIAMTVFGMFFLFECLYGERKPFGAFASRILRRFIAPLAVFVVYLFMRRYATGFAAGFYANEGLFASAIELWRAFVELTLNMVVPHPYRHTGTLWLIDHVWVGIAAFVVMIGGAFAVMKRNQAITFFFFAFVLSSVPYLYVLFHPLNNSGERYTYLPSLFVAPLFVCVILSLEKFRHARVVAQFAIWFVLALSATLLFQKNQVWQTAGAVARRIVTSYSTLEIPADDYVFFIGLPDNLSGAELFRNAIKEGLMLEGVAANVTGERVPMYTVLSQQNAFEQLFAVQKENSLHFSFEPIDRQRLFTGFPDYAYPLATFTMREPDKLFSGNGLSAAFNRVALDSLKKEGKNAWLVYYSQGVLKKISVGE